MKLLFILVGVALVLLFSGCRQFSALDLLNGVLPKKGYALQQDIAYGQHARQKFDIYRSKHAKSNKQKPIVFFIYGGAWRSGDKADYAFVAHALAAQGYDVVIPDYRLFPAVQYPSFIEDVADAVAYLEQNAQHYLQYQPRQMVLMGHSAGAHTVALLATDQRYFSQRKIKTKLAGLIALSGPYDLPLEDAEVKPVFTQFTHEDEVKPLRLVHKNMPEVLLLHGLKDKRVLPFHTKNFTKALQQAGVKHESKFYKNVGHAGIIASMAAPLRLLNDSYQDVTAFLERVSDQE